jgi:ribosomal-protein-alanine N-acetyltransferase
MTSPIATPALDRTLTTQRLELRPIEAADVDALWPYVSDPELPRFMSWEVHRDRSETVHFVSMVMATRRETTGYVWTMRLDGALIGLIGLEGVVRVMRAWRQDRAELGYWCGATHRNQGMVTEAAREVIRFGFEELGLHKIAVGCVADNQASRRVIEKLGFRFVGTERDHFFRFGRWWDHLAFEMLVHDWRR